MDTATHLNTSAQAALALSDDERIHKIRTPRWIGYPRAKMMLEQLEDCLSQPKTHRMSNLLIVGSTNNGKSKIIARFSDKHPAFDNPDGDGITIPVLSIQSPPVLDENRFYNEILGALFAAFKPDDHASRKQMQVIGLLKRLNVKMLIIDDFQHLLASTMDKQRTFLNVIKYFGNELQIPIVAVGVKDAFRAIQTDPQLSNRFEPAILPKWQMDQEFLRLLASFEAMLPLKEPSGLTETTMAAKLLSMSEGTIGDLSKLLNKAAIHAIKSKSERITIKVLSSINWIPPSEHKRQVDKVL